MIGRIVKKYRNKYRRCKAYAQEIGLEGSTWDGVRVLIDYTISSLCYGFGMEDYFAIGNGYTLSKFEKQRFYSLKRALKFQKKVNNPEYRHYLRNKAESMDLFKELISRNWLYAPKSSYSEFEAFIDKTPIFIAKPVRGKCGKGIEKHFIEGTSEEERKRLYEHFVKDDMLLDECLKAHDDIYLGTAALSTIRVYTMIDGEGGVHILKAKYRVGTGDAITDTADGCIAYPISIEHGVIEGPGINEVLNSKQYFYHPDCEKLVVGMKIPKWDNVIEIVTKAVKKIPQLRFVGWDIAITNNSVEIIEGNHNPYHGTFEIMGIERLWWPKIKALE